MKRFREFLEQGAWRRMKKSDWIVVALVGVLLLVIALPTGQAKESEDGSGVREETNGMEAEGDVDVDDDVDGYVESLERRLCAVLSQMDGVGRVEVMVTLADGGERVLEKDVSKKSASTAEEDADGGKRTVTEIQSEEETVYAKGSSESTPYVQKENMPKIQGVVVVAEGGGKPAVASEISDAVMALFQVEIHRIKVVKMCSREE